ncbi:MAG: hypothetical protein IPJ69_02275 [Deltaproteobacteria bacterium]|nr:MAG: hypothetical protein IPJ69_02275 [Deltaproteobacteria bacterium]
MTDNLKNLSLGNLTDTLWSSTETASTNAWIAAFGIGDTIQINGGKNVISSIRCARSF